MRDKSRDAVLESWIGIVVLFISCVAMQAQELPYRNPALPVEQRVADLISRMTLEEKVAQLEGAWENRQFHSDPQTMFIDEKGNLPPERAAVQSRDAARRGGGVI